MTKPPAAGGVPRRDGMQARVLLVDDDEDYALFVKQLLHRIGVDGPMDVVHDAEGAEALLEKRRYDIVVSDYDLGAGNGVRVLEAARRLSPEAQRILLTSAPDRAQRHLDHGKGDGLAHGLWDKRWELGRIRDQLKGLFAY